MGVRSLTLTGLASTLGVLALTASTASAAPPAQFGEAGEGAGQFKEPRGIAVDQASGDVYVADRDNRRVDKFGPEGEFLLAWGWGVANGASELQTCGPEGSSASCEPGLPGAGSGQFGEQSAIGVAVDDSLDLSHGDVYVEDGTNHRIEKFGPDGEFILMFGGEVNKKTKKDVCLSGEECTTGEPGAGAGEFEPLSPRTIAVDSAGTVYVGDNIGPGGENGRVQEFSEAGMGVGQVSVPGGGSTFAVAVGSSEEIYISSERLPGVREYNAAGSEVAAPRDPSAELFNTDLAFGPHGELFLDDPSNEGHHLLEYSSSGSEVESFVEEAAPALEIGHGIVFGAGGVYVLHETAVHFQAPPPPGPVVPVGSEAASDVLPISATVAAKVNAEGHETTYHFEYDTKPYAQGEGPHGTSTTPALLPGAGGFEDQPASAGLTGLQPSTTYHFRVVAENECEPVEHPHEICMTAGPDQTFVTLPPVSIDSTSVSQVTATSALLETRLNPHSLPARFHFEYLTEAEFKANGESFSGTSYKPISAPAPEAGEAGSGTADVPLSVLVENLTPGAAYRYRVVAASEVQPGKIEDFDGNELTFTTQPVPTSGTAATRLIDGRGWEMVSPPEKHGVTLESLTEEGGVIQAAEGGGAIAYIAKAPIDSQPAGSRSLADTQLLSTRTVGGGSSSWSTHDIATPHEAVTGLVAGSLSEYRLFSPDLSSALVEPEGATPLSEEASERTPYLRRDTACEASPGTCYQPLVTAADVRPLGTKFGASEPGGVRGASTGVEFAGATPDLRHVVLRAPQTLSEGFDAGAGTEQALYEWSAGKPASEPLAPISILPDEESAAVEGGAALGRSGADLRGAISSDGSRVFFTTTSTAPHLYMRDTALSKTLQIDLPEPGCVLAGKCAVVPAEPHFEIASSDGSRVFFTDERDLTSDATATQKKPDLYECEVVQPAPGQLGCVLSDLSVARGAGEAGDVQGVVLGSSERGCDVGSGEPCEVYFVANGALTANAAPGGCFNLGGGFCNLYVYDASTGATRLIAELAGSEYHDWEAGGEADLGEVTARVSPNGRYLAFMSQSPLTGYDNEDVTSRAPSERLDEEVYEYDSQGEGGAGALTCVSCAASGARPAGVYDPNEQGTPEEARSPGLLVDRPNLWPGRWLAGSVPGWTPMDKKRAIYQSRYLQDDGRLFFDSPLDLVSGAVNAREDVYEYEPAGPPGAGCGPSSASGSNTFKPAHAFQAHSLSGGEPVSGEEPAGCVGLISAGTSSEESAFLDASGMGSGGEEGEDVFFLTAAKLAPQDTDSALDVYDAHECSTTSPCPTAAPSVPAACGETADCRTTGREPNPQPGLFAAPATANLAGPGNLAAPPPTAKPKLLTRTQKLTKALKACHKEPKEKRASCEKQARRTYGSKTKRSRKGKGAKS